MQFGKIDGCQNLGFLASTDEDYSGYWFVLDIQFPHFPEDLVKLGPRSIANSLQLKPTHQNDHISAKVFRDQYQLTRKAYKR